MIALALLLLALAAAASIAPWLPTVALLLLAWLLFDLVGLWGIDAYLRWRVEPSVTEEVIAYIDKRGRFVRMRGKR